jgi:hypothetical protein
VSKDIAQFKEIKNSDLTLLPMINIRLMFLEALFIPHYFSQVRSYNFEYQLTYYQVMRILLDTRGYLLFKSYKSIFEMNSSYLEQKI